MIFVLPMERYRNYRGGEIHHSLLPCLESKKNLMGFSKLVITTSLHKVVWMNQWHNYPQKLISLVYLSQNFALWFSWLWSYIFGKERVAQLLNNCLVQAVAWSSYLTGLHYRSLWHCTCIGEMGRPSWSFASSIT